MSLVINLADTFKRIVNVYAGPKAVKSTISSSMRSRKLAQGS
jgi:hypothetical protein